MIFVGNFTFTIKPSGHSQLALAIMLLSLVTFLTVAPYLAIQLGYIEHVKYLHYRTAHNVCKYNTYPCKLNTGTTYTSCMVENR